MAAGQAHVPVVDRISLIHVRCFAHSMVLCDKPLMKTLGISSNVVRLGHLLESGRSHSELLKCIFELFDDPEDGFTYEYFEVLPANVAENRVKAKRVLHLTRPLRDLTEEQEDWICDALNCDWDKRAPGHLCSPHCRFNCRGRPAMGRKVAIQAVRLCVGGRCPIALEYRWKGMEAASCYVFRGRRCCDFLGRAIKKMFPAAEVTRASDHLFKNLAKESAPTAETQKLKRIVRGGTVAAEFGKDAGAKRTEVGIVLNKPIQDGLNKGFAAEKTVNQFMDALLRVPCAEKLNKVPDEVERLRAEALKMNLSFVSGDVGWTIVEDYFSLVSDFEGLLWQGLLLSDKDKQEVSAQLVIGMADAWKRLVFICDDPKLKIFRMCAVTEFNAEWVSHVAEPLRNLHDACAGCVDASFTEIWAARLAEGVDDSVRRRAFRCLGDFLASLKMSTSRNERKHILGQECARTKRGRAVPAEMLSKVTYAKSVESAHRHLLNVVQNDVFGGTSKEATGRKRSFSRMMGNRAMGRSSRITNRSKAASKWLKRAAGMRPKRVMAFNMFCAKEFVSGDLGARRRQLAQRWKDMNAGEKAAYVGMAKTENDLLDKAFSGQMDMASPDFLNLPKDNIRPSTYQSVVSAAAANTLRKLQQHPAWHGGSQMSSFEGGLQPSLVDVNSSREELKTKIAKSFGFCHEPVMNPQLKMSPFQCCHLRHWGLCEKGPFTTVAGIATYNMFQFFKKKLIRSCLFSLASAMLGILVLRARQQRRPCWRSISFS